MSPAPFDSYIAAIKNSIGSNLFRNYFMPVNGKEEDILKDGELSCARFVSSILKIFSLIKETHATVDGTVKDLENSGWVRIEEPRIGSIILWGFADNDGRGPHKHLGFYVGDHTAISNSSKLKTPVEHDWMFGEENRKIEAIYWNRELEIK